jgi:hypothetical protein
MKQKTITISEDTNIKIVFKNEPNAITFSISEATKILQTTNRKVTILIRKEILESFRSGKIKIYASSIIRYLKENPLK